jgi:hypothetical protein
VTWFQRFTAEDEQAIAVFMQRLSMLASPEQPAPGDIRLVWLKGQLLRRWEAERRAHAPLDLADRLQLAGGLALAGGLVAWALPPLLRLIAFVGV